MAILPILEIPHPVLRKRAKRVRSITKRELKLAFDMVDIKVCSECKTQNTLVARGLALAEDRQSSNM